MKVPLVRQVEDLRFFPLEDGCKGARSINGTLLKVLVRPPQELYRANSQYPCGPLQFLNSTHIVKRITAVLAVALQERHALTARQQRICLPRILINEDERSAKRYERHDVPRCPLDSMCPGVGLPQLSIYTDPEPGAVFGGSLRCVIEKRQIEVEPLFKFQRLVAITSMDPVTRLWLLDLLHTPMKRRQSS